LGFREVGGGRGDGGGDGESRSTVLEAFFFFCFFGESRSRMGGLEEEALGWKKEDVVSLLEDLAGGGLA